MCSTSHCLAVQDKSQDVVATMQHMKQKLVSRELKVCNICGCSKRHRHEQTRSSSHPSDLARRLMLYTRQPLCFSCCVHMLPTHVHTHTRFVCAAPRCLRQYTRASPHARILPAYPHPLELRCMSKRKWEYASESTSSRAEPHTSRTTSPIFSRPFESELS